VVKVTYGAGAAAPTTTKTEVDLGAGSEPWQVAITPDGDTALVVLRHAQKLVKISGLKSSPVKSGEVATGSEPTSVALTPTGARAYVANWVDGTVVGVDVGAMTIAQTIDLNATLASAVSLGAGTGARAALAHPRSLAVTNNLDGNDADESVYVTEYFAHRATADSANGANADTSKAATVYRIAVGSGTAAAIPLAPLSDTGFADESGAPTGCFPNQLQAISLNGKYAYVLSICASPKGPSGPKVTATACTPATIATDCTGLVDPVCVKVDGTSANPVCVDVASAKTNTHPVLSVIDTTTNTEVTAATANLNAQFRALYTTAPATPDDASRRYPLVASDIAFVPGTSIAYVSANGADAVFRVRFDAASGAIAEVGSAAARFIDLAPAAAPAGSKGQLPVGIAISNSGKGLAFVASEATRIVSVVDLNTQALQGTAALPTTVPVAAMPAVGSDDDLRLKGKRVFNTGLARWSLKGQAWGACQSCHSDGLTDNVTWYFARGPRQSISLDGTFSKKDASDHRILNWTGIVDEIADFEGNVRGTSGGLGAIVNDATAPTGNAQRINLANAGGNNHAGLNGSATLVADVNDPLALGAGNKSVLSDWANIDKFVQKIRSPRAPTNLDATKVTAGRALFEQKNCQGCHGGDKWTISKVFWTPGVAANAALKTTPWTAPSGMPPSILPAATIGNRFMRFDSGNPGALDQIQCILRNVGTFGLAPASVAVDASFEKRANMTATAQGSELDGNGYNPPSLLGLATGAPYLHAGTARSLEEMLGDAFKNHHQALAVNFLDPSDVNADAQRAELVQFLLSIDAETAALAIPTAGATGGTFCSTP
jgi:mono/diheme cytochrome c family protein